VSRFGAPAVLRAGGLIAAGGLALVAAAPVPALAIVGFAVTGLGLSVVVPLSFSAAGAVDPHGTGVAIARVNLFNYVGFILGAALIGVIAEETNLRWAFAVPAVLAFGIVALAPSFRPGRQGRPGGAMGQETRRPLR
jgi:MFS family permease